MYECAISCGLQAMATHAVEPTESEKLHTQKMENCTKMESCTENDFFEVLVPHKRGCGSIPSAVAPRDRAHVPGHSLLTELP